ncbi:MAG TPA: Lrp/AsnC family transcriptional regulator [Candidatus Nanopelagicaceae bacterium]|nr:Lrp/AsnC family transcriptional regulator [Candidatus Nanopelagicaceae bacterium]
MADQSLPPAVDAIDRRLIALLSEDPRLSVRPLARALGMSPGAVGQRLARLRATGVIRGFILDVDPAALGFGLEVMVALELRQGSPVEETISLLKSLSEVRSIQLVTGRWDLVLTMLVRDQHHLRQVLVGRVWSVADFQHSETMIILETYGGYAPNVSLE